MGIREEREMGDMDDYETLRDMYLTGKIWLVGEMIEANGIEGKIISRGTNYITFNDKDGKVHKAWLTEVRNYRKEYDNYHSRPEQIQRRRLVEIKVQDYLVQKMEWMYIIKIIIH